MRPRVVSEYSDESQALGLSPAPEHNGREVIEVQTNRVQSAKYSPLGKRAKKKSSSKRKK